MGKEEEKDACNKQRTTYQIKLDFAGDAFPPPIFTKPNNVK